MNPDFDPDILALAEETAEEMVRAALQETSNPVTGETDFPAFQRKLVEAATARLDQWDADYADEATDEQKAQIAAARQQLDFMKSMVGPVRN